MKKSFVTGLIVIALIMALSLGTVMAAPNTSIKGKITVWSWNIAARGLRDIIPGFTKLYPNVQVEVKEMGFPDVHQKLLMALTARRGAPDVVSIEDRQLMKYAGRGLLDLTRLANQHKDDFVPFKWKQVIKNGKVWAIPWDSGPAGVFYRRDVFAKYGIDPNAIETWDDYIEAGKKIVSASNGEVKMLSFQQSAAEELQQMITWSLGGGIFNADGKIILNSPENVQAFEIMKKMLDAGIVADTQSWTPAWYGAMKSGTLATYINGVWLGGTLRYQAPETAGKWGVFPVPALEPGGKRATNNGGSTLAIPAQSRNKEAAWAFVEYALATTEGQLTMYKTQDLFPAYKPCFDTPFFDEPVDFYGSQKVRKLFAEIAANIPEYYYTEDNPQAREFLNTGLFEAFSGKKDIKKALADTAHALADKTGRKLAQ